MTEKSYTIENITETVKLKCGETKTERSERHSGNKMTTHCSPE